MIKPIKLSKHNLLHGYDGEEQASIDLTPLMDILFILLVFFMLTAGIALKSLEVSIPSTDNKLNDVGLKSQFVFLQILPNGSYLLNGERFDNLEIMKENIETLIATDNKKTIIAIDKETPSRFLLEIMAYLQEKSVSVAEIIMKEDGN